MLRYPELPLHNNAAELAARSQARNRDVSLQTKSEAGTKVKDTFLTSVHPETSIKIPKLKLWIPNNRHLGVQSFSFGRVSGWTLTIDVHINNFTKKPQRFPKPLRFGCKYFSEIFRYLRFYRFHKVCRVAHYI